MTAAKWTSTKRVAAVCFRKRKPYQLPTLERQLKAARLLIASVAEDVRRKLESIEVMLGSFEEEVFNAGMEGFGVGQRMGPSEEQMMAEGRICDLDHDIENMIGKLHRQIPELRGSKEISCQEACKFRKQLTQLEGRYIDSASFGNDSLVNELCNHRRQWLFWS